MDNKRTLTEDEFLHRWRETTKRISDKVMRKHRAARCHSCGGKAALRDIDNKPVCAVCEVL